MPKILNQVFLHVFIQYLNDWTTLSIDCANSSPFSAMLSISTGILSKTSPIAMFAFERRNNSLMSVRRSDPTFFPIAKLVAETRRLIASFIKFPPGKELKIWIICAETTWCFRSTFSFRDSSFWPWKICTIFKSSWCQFLFFEFREFYPRDLSSR